MSITFIPLPIYHWVFHWIMASLCLVTSLNYISSSNCTKLLTKNSSVIPFLIAILLTLFIGLRPVSGRYFVDMGMYAHGYRRCNVNTVSEFFDFDSEWFFELVMRTTKATIGNINIWFLIIAAFYFLCQWWACKRLLFENVWMAMLFVFFSYQFYTFSTNGVRNGMACALMMLALSYMANKEKIGLIIGSFLFLLAMGCHRSVMIPMAAAIVSLYFIKSIKQAVFIWIGCIALSLVAGSTFLNLFINLGFDDRMSSYSALSTEGTFSHSGFRWDFLLYSAMPVWLAWYIEKKGIRDSVFTFLANTYIIANSFWVLVCRVSYSNRFAYLSWFMYGLVLAYAAIRVPIWRDQDKKAGLILFANSFFTLFMHIIGK